MPYDLTKEEKKFLDKKHEEDMKIALKERSGAFQRGVLLSEVTGRPADWHIEAHHILGRGIPDGFQQAPDVIKEFWPHPPPGCVYLTTAEHRHADENTKLMRPLLLRFMLTEYGKEIWQGQPYWYWLTKPPYVGWLRLKSFNEMSEIPEEAG